MIGFLEERHIALRYRAQAWVDASGIENDHEPALLVERLARHDLLRACVPAAYGGLRERVELRDLCVLRAVIGYRSSLADTMFAMQGLGSYPVTLAGTEAQKQALLPRVASGKTICAFAITEPEAGSDVSGVSTRAVRDGDGYVLDGVKMLHQQRRRRRTPTCCSRAPPTIATAASRRSSSTATPVV